jgi:hypothetical protein
MRHTAQETLAGGTAPLMHPDLICPIAFSELQTAWVLGMK